AILAQGDFNFIHGLPPLIRPQYSQKKGSEHRIYHSSLSKSEAKRCIGTGKSRHEPKPNMHAIVESENPTSLSVRRQAANISRTEWPMKKQLAIAAIIIPVPLRIRG